MHSIPVSNISSLIHHVMAKHCFGYKSLLNTWQMAAVSQTFSNAFLLNKNVWVLITISLMFIPRGPTNNIPALVQVMARLRSGDKPLFEPMKVRLATHIYVTRPVTNTFANVYIQYIPRNMHTVFALLCFVVVIHWLISHIHQAYFTGTVAIERLPQCQQSNPDEYG